MGHVTVHGASVLTHEDTGTGGVLLPRVGNAGNTTETVLELPVVGRHKVGKSVQLGSELALGTLESRLGSGGGTTEGGTLTGNHDLLGAGGGVDLLVQTLGSAGEGLGGGTTLAGHLATEHGTGEASLLGESSNLLGGGSLVGVEDSTELTTGTLGLGVTHVGGVDDHAHLLVHTTVHTDLGLTVTHDLTKHDGDLTLKAGLGGLDLGGQGHDLGVHLLASEGHGAGGGGTHGTDVLHSLGETHVSEGSTLSDLVVQETDRGRHLGVEGLALLGHAGVQLAEAVVGLLLGLGEGTVDLAEGSSVATHRGGIRGGQVGLGGATSGGNASLEGGDVALHLGGDGTGVLGHLVGVAGKLVVGLLELLVGLSLEGEESTILGSHGVADRTGSTTLLTVDLPVEATTGGGGLAVVAGKHSVQGSEAAVGPLHRLLQVGLGLLGGGFDGEEDLLLECLTGSLGLHVESVDGFGGGLAQGRDHGADLGGQSSLVLLVDAAHLLLNSDGTLLTLLDGNRDGMADVALVGGLHGLEHGATLGGLDGVSGNDTGQLVDLVLLLLGDLHGNGVHAGELRGKESLGLTERVSGGTAGGGHLLAVGSTLHGSVLGKGSVELVGSTTEVVGLVATVLLHLMTDLAHLHLERVSHALHATESLGLVLGHEGTELLVLLDVSVVTLVAKLHHALKLSMNVAVHASLLELVASHGVLQGGHTGVELGDLAARGGSGLHEANLELSTRGVDTGSGLLLGIRG